MLLYLVYYCTCFLKICIRLCPCFHRGSSEWLQKRSRRLGPPGGPRGGPRSPAPGAVKARAQEGTRGCIDAAAASLRRCSPSSVEQCSWESLHNEWERRVCSDSSSSFFSPSLSLPDPRLSSYSRTETQSQKRGEA